MSAWRGFGSTSCNFDRACDLTEGRTGAGDIAGWSVVQTKPKSAEDKQQDMLEATNKANEGNPLLSKEEVDRKADRKT